MTQARAEEPDIDVYHPTAQEWQAAVQEGLDDLGITYEELERQARENDFQSAEALGLWVMIGDSRT